MLYSQFVVVGWPQTVHMYSQFIVVGWPQTVQVSPVLHTVASCTLLAQLVILYMKGAEKFKICLYMTSFCDSQVPCDSQVRPFVCGKLGVEYYTH